MTAPSFPERLARLPTTVMLTLAAASIVLVGFLDHATGYELGFAVFYLLPVLLVGWTSGRAAGLGTSLFAAAVWLAVDLGAAHRYSHPLLPYWNAAMRLTIFALTVVLLAGFKAQRTVARTDSLTGLPNRHAFLDTLTLEIERSRRGRRPLTLAYIDCDEFKRVNDRFGHAAGDALLRAVAGALQANVRRVDTAARLGGDEFAVLLPEVGSLAAKAVLRKLQRVLRSSTRAWPVTFSIGAVTFLRAAESADEVIRRADGLMYEAKREGKDSLRTEDVGPDPGEAPPAEAPPGVEVDPD